jgi:hypothetical protein
LQKFFRYVVLVTTLLGGGTAWAAAITGSVKNGTTNQPASGDDVVLLTLSEHGMSESARVKTDSAGHFLFRIIESAGSHLVRVVHQGVTYHSVVHADGKRLKIKVYDVAEKLAGISAVMDVQRFEATDDTLEIKQLVTMRNNSRPPRTLLNDRPFKIQLSTDAKVQSGLVQFGDGQPLKQDPVADEQKGQYHFVFPLRPGDTRFAVVYRLPYTGEALIEPQLRGALEQFVVMLPKSMKFEPKTAGIFQRKSNVTLDHVEGTGPVKPGQTIAFRISGTGRLEELQGTRKQAPEGQTAPQESPGGGLGRPIEAPDPLQEHRWQILAGLIAMLGVGATWVINRSSQHPAERSTASARRKLTVSRNQPVPMPTGRRERRRARVWGA